MENPTPTNPAPIAPHTRKDTVAGVIAGLLIGLLFLPILKAAKPELFSKIAAAIVPFFLIATPLGLAIAYRIGTKLPVIWQIAKFGVIGVLNTLVDIGFLALLTFVLRATVQIDSKDVLLAVMGATLTYYSIYKSLSFIIANINSYYWNKYWTFSNGNNTKTQAQFIQFFAVSIIGFIINVVVASLVFRAISGFTSDQAGLLGAAAGSIIGLVWNFIGYKFFVFKEPTV